MISALLFQLLLFGCAGLLIEVLFTGLHSLVANNIKLTAQTYLWMFPLYATAGTVFSVIDAGCHPTGTVWIDMTILAVFVYLPIMYGYEILFGFLLDKLIGVIPWDYGQGKWTIMGLTRIDYAPYWLALALAIHPIDIVVRWLLGRIL